MGRQKGKWTAVGVVLGVSGIGEYKSSAAVPLVTSIVLPDYSQYTFTYEPTPSLPASSACTPYAGTTCVTARIASVQLPTGGTLSYAYYNNGGNFAACTVGNNGIYSDGSASCLKRTTPDGAWTAFVPLAGSGAPLGAVARYLQYQVSLATTNPDQTPTLQAITFE